jgi:anti-sigma factor RsiW
MSNTLSHEQMLDIMAYNDGELAGDDIDRVEALLSSNPEAKEFFVSIEAIGDGLRSVLDVPAVDVRDAVMGKLRPNDLDKARLRRIARTRAALVGASIVAIAAAVLFYVRSSDNGSQSSHNPHEKDGVLATASTSGVQVDYVDTPESVSVFYVPASSAGSEGQTTGPGTDAPTSVVVWVDDKAATP